jgi:hypothetical protein
VSIFVLHSDEEHGEERLMTFLHWGLSDVDDDCSWNIDQNFNHDEPPSILSDIIFSSIMDLFLCLQVHYSNTDDTSNHDGALEYSLFL